jgi:hypothetical protein
MGLEHLCHIIFKGCHHLRHMKFRKYSLGGAKARIFRIPVKL